MSIWLDAAVILIMILTCVVGYVRGFRKSIVGIGIAVISTLAASWASGARIWRPCSPWEITLISC